LCNEPDLAEEELVLRNTFINAKIGEIEEFKEDVPEHEASKLVWMDHNTN